jgi:hypothetical protein
MSRTALAGVFAFAVALAGPSALLRAADDGADLVGVWEGQVDGYKEMWTLTNQNGRWNASGNYLKNGKQVGAAIGQNTRYADGVLTFTQKLIKTPPNVTWIDSATITVKRASDKVSYSWDVAGLTGSREWTRVGDAPATTTSTTTTSADAGSLVGSWQGAVDGITEVLTIKNDNGNVTVSGVFMKNGSEVGSFTGKDPRLTNNTLSYVQQFDKKPDGVGWIDNANISVYVNKGGKLEYHWHHGKQRGARQLEPAK